MSKLVYRWTLPCSTYKKTCIYRGVHTPGHTYKASNAARLFDCKFGIVINIPLINANQKV